MAKQQNTPQQPKSSPTEKKRLGARVWSFLKKHFGTPVVIVSFIGGILGGITGAINIWNWATDAPEFDFHAVSLTHGSYVQNGIDFQFFVLSGAVYNDGKQPLFPIAFNLDAKYDDTTLQFVALPIIDSLFKNMDPIIASINAEHDLLNIVKVNSKDANYGMLFFPIPIKRDIPITNYNTLKLTCIGINKKEYSYTIKKSDFNAEGSIYEPKSGIKVNLHRFNQYPDSIEQ